jgi:hypothetical protein
MEHSDGRAPGERSAPASRSVAAAAARWGDEHPDEDVEHAPPSAPAESDGIVPNRHSASAEAASLRWHERHDDDG